MHAHRFEDYQANVKSGAAAPAATPNPFGAPGLFSKDTGRVASLLVPMKGLSKRGA